MFSMILVYVGPFQRERNGGKRIQMAELRRKVTGNGETGNYSGSWNRLIGRDILRCCRNLIQQCRRRVLGRHLFVGERRNLGALARMFYCDCANVIITVQVYDRVLIKVLGFVNRSLAELDIECVGICKIFCFPGTNDRSKNALCRFRHPAAKGSADIFPQLHGSKPNVGCVHPTARFPVQDTLQFVLSTPA
jgi:hypothetical protein